MKSELEVMFKEQNLKIMNGFEQVVSNITGGFNDENVDIKKRVTVLETKVKVLENK